MCKDSWRRWAVLALTVAFTAPLAAQGPVHPAGVGLGAPAPPDAVSHWHVPVLLSWPDAPAAASPGTLWPPRQATEGGTPLPNWVRWGIVGAVAGAVTFPLLGSLAVDNRRHPVREAVAGAVSGFVLVGGSVALWEVVCGGPTRSRRAGLCGR